MIHPIRRGGAHGGCDREWVFDIALVKRHTPKQLLDRARVAAPAFEGVNLKIGQRQQIIGQEAADRASDAGDKNAGWHGETFPT